MLLETLSLAIVVLLSQVHVDLASTDSQLYIVYMGKKQHEDHRLNTKLHHETLASVLGSHEMARDAIIHSYKHGFSGFAARITSAHAHSLSMMPEVLAVFPSGMVKGHTTRSWDFMGVFLNDSHGVLEKAKYGADVIIGIIDSGIWPEAESFNDEGMPPVPERWKGICQAGEAFSTENCNRKIIGARYFNQGYKAEVGSGEDILKLDYQSPRDNHSHGTHVASTAAGRSVQFEGDKTARGGAPLARLAIYKALYAPTNSGTDADIMAAIDQAIHDGVDIISFSIGGDDGLSSLAMFHAAENGILVVASAGNRGPALARVSNTAPWILTVAASTTDRSFEVPFQLGDSANRIHKAKYYGKLALPVTTGWQSLVFLSRLRANSSESQGKYVAVETESLSGKIDILLALEAELAGALGVIVVEPPSARIGIPWFQVSPSVFSELHAYSTASSSPTINFGNVRTVFGSDPAPMLATFSSRGSGQLFPDILKPDVTAPGVDILAAVPPPDRKVSFLSRTLGLESGTSMSCPHVSGVAALIKSLHPTWSPAAIKSAIMTTASPMDNTGDTIRDMYTQESASPLGYGAGHIHPLKAADPGLVYDATVEDYERFLCTVGYTVTNESNQLVGQTLKSHCSLAPLEASQLNYPSITVSTVVGESRTVKRVVTNVGDVKSTYKVTVKEPQGVKITVKPDTLEFDESVNTRLFEVTVVAEVKRQYSFGSITWTDGVHIVRSPILVQE